MCVFHVECMECSPDVEETAHYLVGVFAKEKVVKDIKVDARNVDEGEKRVNK